MVLRLIPIVALIVLSSCSGSENEQQDLQSPPDGKTLFVNNCASCHGMDGRLGLSGASDLGTSKLTIEEVVSILKNGRNAMPSFEVILKNDESIEAVAEFTLELRK